MDDEISDRDLARLHRAARRRPAYAAFRLAVWSAGRGLTDAGAPAALGVSLRAYRRLGLWLVPRPGEREAWLDRAAARFGVGRERLGEAVGEVNCG